MEIKFGAVAKYAGHKISPNGAVDLVLGTSYDQLENSVKLLQLLNNDVVIAVKLPDDSPFKLGMFRVKSVNVAHDGTSKLTFNGLTDYVETDNLNRLVGSDLFQVKFRAEVELEGDDENEG